MARIPQSKTELMHHLKEQMAFMVSSADAYDRGFQGKARRLAVSIRILVHDTSKSQALLSLVGKKKIRFLDTASPYDPNNLLPSNCLTMVQIKTKEGGAYVAPLDDLSPARTNRKIPFNDWWFRNIIYRDNNRNTFTRKSLVLNVSNTDGGAQIDPTLDEAYARFSRFDTLGWKFFRNGIAEEFQNTPILPSIRQIAHELLKTLKDEFPDLWEWQ